MLLTHCAKKVSSRWYGCNSARERGREGGRKGGWVTSVSTQEKCLSLTTHTHFFISLWYYPYQPTSPSILNTKYKFVSLAVKAGLTSSQCKIKPIPPSIAHDCIQVAHPPNQLYCPALISYALWPCKKCTLRQHEGGNRGIGEEEKRKRAGEGNCIGVTHSHHPESSPSQREALFSFCCWLPDQLTVQCPFRLGWLDIGVLLSSPWQSSDHSSYTLLSAFPLRHHLLIHARNQHPIPTNTTTHPLIHMPPTQ